MRRKLKSSLSKKKKKLLTHGLRQMNVIYRFRRRRRNEEQEKPEGREERNPCLHDTKLEMQLSDSFIACTSSSQDADTHTKLQ